MSESIPRQADLHAPARFPELSRIEYNKDRAVGYTNDGTSLNLRVGATPPKLSHIKYSKDKAVGYFTDGTQSNLRVETTPDTNTPEPTKPHEQKNKAATVEETVEKHQYDKSSKTVSQAYKPKPKYDRLPKPEPIPHVRETSPIISDEAEAAVKAVEADADVKAATPPAQPDTQPKPPEPTVEAEDDETDNEPDVEVKAVEPDNEPEIVEQEVPELAPNKDLSAVVAESRKYYIELLKKSANLKGGRKRDFRYARNKYEKALDVQMAYVERQLRAAGMSEPEIELKLDEIDGAENRAFGFPAVIPEASEETTSPEVRKDLEGLEGLAQQYKEVYDDPNRSFRSKKRSLTKITDQINEHPDFSGLTEEDKMRFIAEMFEQATGTSKEEMDKQVAPQAFKRIRGQVGKIILKKYRQYTASLRGDEQSNGEADAGDAASDEEIKRLLEQDPGALETPDQAAERMGNILRSVVGVSPENNDESGAEAVEVSTLDYFRSGFALEQGKTQRSTAGIYDDDTHLYGVSETKTASGPEPEKAADIEVNAIEKYFEQHTEEITDSNQAIEIMEQAVLFAIQKKQEAVNSGEIEENEQATKLVALKFFEAGGRPQAVYARRDEARDEAPIVKNYEDPKTGVSMAKDLRDEDGYKPAEDSNVTSIGVLDVNPKDTFIMGSKAFHKIWANEKTKSEALKTLSNFGNPLTVANLLVKLPEDESADRFAVIVDAPYYETEEELAHTA